MEDVEHEIMIRFVMVLTKPKHHHERHVPTVLSLGNDSS